jgi:phenylalanyl-tRNA synthetase beta chain
VTLRTARAAKVIGVPVTDEMVADIFTRLHLPFTQEPGLFHVTAPSYRFDIEIEEDLIEEVARVYGFENIPALPPVAPGAMLIEPENTRSLFAIRHQLADLGYQEVVNMSFVEQQWEPTSPQHDPIRLQNPIASQMSVMRSTLIGSLVANVRYNLNRKAGRVRVFESAPCSSQRRRPGRSAVGCRLRPAQARRRHRLRSGAGRAVGRRRPARSTTSTSRPTWKRCSRRGRAFCQGRASGAASGPLRFGRSRRQGSRLHRRTASALAAEVRPAAGAGAVRGRRRRAVRARVPSYTEISKFPGATRDLALVVKQDVPAQALIDAFHAELASNELGRLVQAVVLFDEYRGKGLEQDEKSLAFRFGLQDTQSTLQDDASRPS